jgi:hypothetical protein
MKVPVTRKAIVARIRRKLDIREQFSKMTPREVSSCNVEHGSYMLCFDNCVQEMGDLEYFAEKYGCLAGHEVIEAE